MCAGIRKNRRRVQRGLARPFGILRGHRNHENPPDTWREDITVKSIDDLEKLAAFSSFSWRERDAENPSVLRVMGARI